MSRKSKWLGFLLGLASVLSPAGAGYFSMKQSKLDLEKSKLEQKKEASIAYEAVAQPSEAMRQAIAVLDWRVQQLEKEHAAKASIDPIQPRPLSEPALNVRVPQTLLEADAVHASKN